MWDFECKRSPLFDSDFYCHKPDSVIDSSIQHGFSSSFFEGQNESYEFVNYDVNPTPLFRFVLESEWENVIKMCREDPSQARVWVYRMDKDDVTSLRWKMLPLHAAIVYKCPPAVVETLLSIYPDAVEKKNHRSQSALHLAFIEKASSDILSILIKATPDASDKCGWLPSSDDYNNGNQWRAGYLETGISDYNEFNRKLVEEEKNVTAKMEVGRSNDVSKQHNPVKDADNSNAVEVCASQTSKKVCPRSSTVKMTKSESFSNYTCDTQSTWSNESDQTQQKGNLIEETPSRIRRSETSLRQNYSDSFSVYTEDTHSTWSTISDQVQQRKNNMMVVGLSAVHKMSSYLPMTSKAGSVSFDTDCSFSVLTEETKTSTNGAGVKGLVGNVWKKVTPQ